MITKQIDLAVVTKTWANENNLCLQLVDGYIQNSVYRNNKAGGGVTMYANKNLEQTLMHTSITNNAEIVAVSIAGKILFWESTDHHK